MQTTLRPTRTPLGFSRNQLLALGLAAGLLALSIVGYVTRHDSAPAAASQQRAASAMSATGNFRFREANLVLPGVEQAAVSNTHVLEINALPGDSAPVAPASVSNTHMLEINQLPGDDVQQSTSSGLLMNRR